MDALSLPLRTYLTVLTLGSLVSPKTAVYRPQSHITISRKTKKELTLMVSLLQNFALKVAAALTATGIISILSYLISSRFRSVVRRLLHFTFDTTVQVQLTRVDRYEGDPVEALDMGIFREISELSETITFDAIDHDQNILRIQGDELPTPLEIRIEPMPTLEAGTPVINRYEVRVATYTDITFGYRSNDSLDEFRTLSDDIARVIQKKCFENATPEKTFLTGKIQGTLPTNEKKIHDEDIEMRAQVKDDEVTMTFKDPRYLTRGIQKYFQPLQ